MYKYFKLFFLYILYICINVFHWDHVPKIIIKFNSVYVEFLVPAQVFMWSWHFGYLNKSDPIHYYCSAKYVGSAWAAMCMWTWCSDGMHRLCMSGFIILKKNSRHLHKITQGCTSICDSRVDTGRRLQKLFKIAKNNGIFWLCQYLFAQLWLPSKLDSLLLEKECKMNYLWIVEA